MQCLQVSGHVCEINDLSLIAVVTYMLVGDGFGHERDSQDDYTGDNKQDDGEVEVVDSTYNGGTVTGVNTASCPISKLGNHPGQAYSQANHEAVKCTLKKKSRRNCQCRVRL